MAKTVSGREAIRILTREFGFRLVSQKGSHIKLRKITSAGAVTTVVPDHHELAHGTLKGILRLAKVSEVDFWNHV